MIEKWFEISKNARISIRLIVVAIFLRLVLHVLNYTVFTPKFTYIGNDLAVISGVLFYLFLFSILIFGILHKNKLIKFYAVFLSVILFMGLFLGGAFKWSLIDCLWVMNFILIATATVMLFVIDSSKKTV